MTDKMKQSLEDGSLENHIEQETAEGAIENKEENTVNYSVKKIEVNPEDQKAIEQLSEEFTRNKNMSAYNESLTKKIIVAQSKETGGEPYQAPVVEMTPRHNANFLRRAGLGVVFTLGSLLGFGKAKAETVRSDSTKNKVDNVRGVEDSTKTNKETTGILKNNKIEWVEVSENIGGLIVEAKATVPFSDTTKEVMVIKFASGTDEEMIAAVMKGGYKILSAKDFQKMYLENKSEIKNLRQTFSGEKVEDIDDTKIEKYVKADDEGVKIDIKRTHGVYPYISANGSLTRYEEGQQLNYEAGLAVYKEKK